MTDDQNKDVESTDEVSQPESQSKSLLERLFCPSQWLRFLFMVMFSVILSVLSYLVFLLVVLQFIIVLVTGKDNERLRDLGSDFTLYIAQILQFLTYNSDQKPFPFDDWPSTPRDAKK